MSKCVVVACFLASISFASSAHASCRDILANGTFQNVVLKDNDYFQQINYSRFLQSTYESSKRDMALGASVPIGPKIMGSGDYSEASYNMKKEQLESTFLYKVTSARELDLAMMSGDKTIVDAWKTCMLNEGGPSARFEVQSPTDIFFTIEFFSAPGTQTALLTDIPLPPGAVVTSGGECLKAGLVLKAKVPCVAAVEIPADRKWGIAVNTAHGSTSAYLAPRVRSKKEYRPFAFAENCDNLGKTPSQETLTRCKDRIWSYAHKQTLTPSYTVRVPQELIDQGWQFDVSSASAPWTYISRYSPSGMSGCSNRAPEVKPYSFTYSYQNLAQPRGNDGVSQIYCQANPSINMVREVWVPQT